MHSKLLKKKTSLVSKALFGALLVTTFFAPLQGLFVSQAKAQSVVNARATSDANNPNISPTASGATASGQGGTAGPSGAGQTAVECSWSPSNWGICFTNVVYVFTVGLMSVFAYIGAFIFDTAIQITLQSVTYSQYFLTQSWAAVRDLANMIFIFLLVYLAVTVILQAETQGTMKMLAGIIIAALLINFSFFFTRLVIDGGNILATQFYNAIPAPTLNSSGATGTGTVGAVQSAASSLSSNGNVKDLTRGIMDVVGVQSILGSGSFARFSQQGANEFTKIITLVFVYIAVAIILAMLAFTFIAVGVKFLVRIVVLWLAIIASPLAFVFGAMYKKGSADRFNVLSRWGKALIEYAFYPAVFLFIFWIINFFATQLAGNGASSILANALNDAGSAATNGQLFTIASAVAGVSVRLGIIVALMYMAMRVSDSFAKTGYKAIDTYGTGLARRATGWTQPYLRGFVQKPVAATKAVARLPITAAQGVGGYAYRNTVAKKAKEIGDKASKSRWANTESIFNWRDRAANDVLQKRIVKPITEVKPFGATSFTEAKKYKDDRTKEHKKNVRTLDNKDIIKQLADNGNKFDSNTYNKLSERTDLEKDLALVSSSIGNLKSIIATTTGGATLGQQNALTKLQAEEATLQAKQASLPALSPAEKTQFNDLSKQKSLIDEWAKEINSFSKPEIEATLSKDDINKIMKHVSEPLLKKIEELDKFSDQDKADFRHKYETESEHSATKLAEQEVGLLQKIYLELKRDHKDPNTYIGMHTIDNLLVKGRAFTPSDAQLIIDEIKEKTAEARKITDPKERVLMQESLRDMKDSLKTLKTQTAKANGGKITIT